MLWKYDLILFNLTKEYTYRKTNVIFDIQKYSIVPDLGSRSRVVVFVGAGCWEFGVGRDGEGLRKGRSVHE
jgi:hypothetical protein